MRTLGAAMAMAMALCAGCGDNNGKTQADAAPHEPESRYEPAPGYVDYAPSGSPRSGAGAPESAAIKPAPPPPDTSGDEVLAPSGARTYVVQKGDTLSSLARKFYGDQKRWKDIYQANKQLTNPNKLPVGTKLIIP
ncbi:MAG: LysM peptidoglycan-binding domain-containing protein [Phycisphaerae bacterium]|jgi:nucleoid-associated protein YgaU|nr:LysM peptidoglycan-binding domain-containing protein [Phycisphaerae bacterium]